MDWAAVASILGERHDRPLMLLDHAARIRMFNRVMEKVLGWRRFEVDGEPWSTYTPPEYRDETQRWIEDALRGALSSFEARGLSKSGTQIVFGFEFALVGAGATQGLLVTAAHWKAAESVRLTKPGELDYDVMTEPTTFGTLARLIVDSERIQFRPDSRCFQVLHGLDEPCDGCPLQSTAETPWPRVVVRPVGSDSFEVKSAAPLEAGLVRIRSRTLSDHALEAIHAAKIRQLADRADLSAREREVLTYLMLGRAIEDIAFLIGIAVRTVKYHQANVLQKLGADSRSDLLRLLF